MEIRTYKEEPPVSVLEVNHLAGIKSTFTDNIMNALLSNDMLTIGEKPFSEN